MTLNYLSFAMYRKLVAFNNSGISINQEFQRTDECSAISLATIYQLRYFKQLRQCFIFVHTLDTADRFLKASALSERSNPLLIRMREHSTVR